MNSIEYFIGGRRGLFALFVQVDRGGCRMSTLVHSRGEGVKIGSKLVHVVVECPLNIVKSNRKQKKDAKARANSYRQKSEFQSSASEP